VPHITVEYSANLDGHIDMQTFCEAMRVAAVALEIFPSDGVRVRALRADHYAIADGDAANTFVDISVRLREGRPLEAKQHATSALFDAAKAALADVIAQVPIMLSLEMRDIDAKLAPKLNTIRDRIRRPQ